MIFWHDNFVNNNIPCYIISTDIPFDIPYRLRNITFSKTLHHQKVFCQTKPITQKLGWESGVEGIRQNRQNRWCNELYNNKYCCQFVGGQAANYVTPNKRRTVAAALTNNKLFLCAHRLCVRVSACAHVRVCKCVSIYRRITMTRLYIALSPHHNSNSTISIQEVLFIIQYQDKAERNNRRRWERSPLPPSAAAVCASASRHQAYLPNDYTFNHTTILMNAFKETDYFFLS